MHVVQCDKCSQCTTSMTSIRLPTEMEKKLAALCELTQRSKSFYIKQTLERHLEDLEDTYIALERISNSKRKFLTTEEVLKELQQ